MAQPQPGATEEPQVDLTHDPWVPSCVNQDYLPLGHLGNEGPAADLGHSRAGIRVRKETVALLQAGILFLVDLPVFILT